MQGVSDKQEDQWGQGVALPHSALDHKRGCETTSRPDTTRGPFQSRDDELDETLRHVEPFKGRPDGILLYRVIGFRLVIAHEVQVSSPVGIVPVLNHIQHHVNTLVGTPIAEEAPLGRGD